MASSAPPSAAPAPAVPAAEPDAAAGPPALAPVAAVNTYIYVDCSGSVGGSLLYHTKALEIVEAAFARSAAEGGSCSIIMWDTSSRPESLEDFRLRCASRRGGGGTDTTTVAASLVERGANGRLVLITDGQVPGYAVDTCDALLSSAGGSIVLTEVEAYLIGPRGAANMSVTAPFTRTCPHVVILFEAFGQETVESRVTLADMRKVTALDGIATLEQFNEEYEALHRAIVAKCMGTAGDAPLRAQILALQARVTRDMAGKAGGETANALLEALRAGDAAAAEACAVDVIKKHTEGTPTDFSGKISVLLRYCEGALRTSFRSDQIASQRAVLAAQATAAPAVPAALDEDEGVGAPLVGAAAGGGGGAPGAAPEEPFVCPVMLEETKDNVVLLLTHSLDAAPGEGDVPPAIRYADGDDPNAFLVGLNKAVVDAVLDCPLALLQPAFDKQLTRLLERLDHPVSLAAFDAAAKETAAGGHNPLARSPLSRRPLLRRGLCLGPALDHVTATDSALFKLVAGGKKLASADLWFAVIYLGLERKVAKEDAEAAAAGAAAGGGAPAAEARPRFSYLKPILPSLRNHLEWRLARRSSYASLSGLATTVTARIPLGAAVWFSYAGARVQSTLMPRQEALRLHAPYADALKRLIELQGFPITPEQEAFAVRTCVLLHMLLWVKGGKAAEAEFASTIRALHQRAHKLDLSAIPEEVQAREGPIPLYVPLDGPAPPEQVEAVLASLPSLYRSLDAPTLVGLARQVDPSKPPVRVGVDAEKWAPFPLPEPEVCWPELSDPSAFPEEALKPLDILPATMRPRLGVAPGTTWREAEAAARQRPAPVEGRVAISSTKAWMEYAGKYGAYPPSLDAFLAFVYRREVAAKEEEFVLRAGGGAAAGGGGRKGGKGGKGAARPDGVMPGRRRARRGGKGFRRRVNKTDKMRPKGGAVAEEAGAVPLPASPTTLPALLPRFYAQDAADFARAIAADPALKDATVGVARYNASRDKKERLRLEGGEGVAAAGAAAGGGGAPAAGAPSDAKCE